MLHLKILGARTERNSVIHVLHCTVVKSNLETGVTSKERYVRIAVQQHVLLECEGKPKRGAVEVQHRPMAYATIKLLFLSCEPEIIDDFVASFCFARIVAAVKNNIAKWVSSFGMGCNGRSLSGIRRRPVVICHDRSFST
jgi:hypothetical protein